MAIDAYMFFRGYKGASPAYLVSESQVVAKFEEPLGAPFKAAGSGNIFEVEDYSFDIEQTLNIGSQSSGAGAGKVTFNPFSITRKIDKSSPTLFKNACAGTAFAQVSLGLRKSTGGEESGLIFCRFDFKLVAVKTVSWAHDDESPKETVTFEYGALQVFYTLQKPDGKMDTTVVPAGWNRVTNKYDDTDKPIGGEAA